jgi:transporter family-2 protein
VTRPASGGALLLVALGTGCLPTLMLSSNSELAAHGGALLSSWVAHGTGTIAAVVMLLVLAGIG